MKNNQATRASFGSFAGPRQCADVVTAHPTNVVSLSAFRNNAERSSPAHVGNGRVLSMADFGAANIAKRRDLVRNRLITKVCDPDDAPVAYVAAFMHGDGRCTIAGDGVEREFAGMLSDGLSALMGKLERHGAGLPVTG
ncbi:Uncharacterised protein [Burkholderia pseudomallei]|uniref:hypothetical protein n=1 Tax=Burkholderia pseudomallei TaxID=28450 RepID=UPI00050DEE3F|nr:hypothetical protein [Burkholderia pseudomallei]KGD48541.1 hypothetical protein DP43_2407 [Burkholderia pseudomallei]MCW0130287.1 hypothetical protein [Burkholderia pseudomallei]CAJ3000027.1 Uncharacterised protein [Burkholderia pseudomallei]CAJ3764588.1 Uncharacterised protein [Burkholderia pseudomallei]CAJ4339902.1 Uncharacterised protein [Burkholderia pseudomallei]